MIATKILANLTVLDALWDARRKANPHPCRDDGGQFASCGSSGSPDRAARRARRNRKRRRAAAQRRRLGGPDTGTTPQERRARRLKAGAHRRSRLKAEADAAAGRLSPEHTKLVRTQAKERRELAGEIRDARRDLAKDRAKEHRDLRREFARDHAKLQRDQARERAALPKRQKRQAEALDAKHQRQLAKLDARHGADPTPRQQEARDAKVQEHAEERETLRAEHADERRELRRTHRQERRELREQYRGQVEGQRQADRDNLAALHGEHRGTIEETRQGHRDDRAARHWEDRYDRRHPEEAGKAWGGPVVDPAAARVRDLAARVKALAEALGSGRISAKVHGDPANTLGGDGADLGWKGTTRRRKPREDQGPGRKPRKPAGASGGGNCGTGAHGFEPGNHCQRPGHGGAESPAKPSKPAAARPASRPSRFHTPEHGPGIDRKLAIDRAAEKGEVEIAGALKGRHVGDYDELRKTRKPPYDVHIPAKKSPTGRDEFLEVKYKSQGAKNELSVHADAKLRKADHQAEAPDSGFHTVLIDVRDRAFGGSEAGHYQGHDLYYRRGAGAYSTANMHRVKDLAELRRLVAMPDHDLPEAARGTMPVRTPELEAQAAKVEASRARRDGDGKKEERRRRYNERKRAGLLGTAVAAGA